MDEASRGRGGAGVSEKTDRLTEIEARLKAATPGPWVVERADWQNLVRREGKGPGRNIASVGGTSALGHNGGADADLIAHAPADLALLVRIVRSVADAPCDCPELFVCVELDAEPLYRKACALDGERHRAMVGWPCRVRRELEAAK